MQGVVGKLKYREIKAEPVSVLAMFFSENWKRLEVFFIFISSFLWNRRNNLFQKFSFSLFQYSERTIATKSGRGIIRREPCLIDPKAYFVEFYDCVEGFWLLVFYEISRIPFLSYSPKSGRGIIKRASLLMLRKT